MPIYEYQCQSCEHEFETIQKISDSPLTECPSCGKHRLKKKISAVAFRLKGGGWYETDFKSGDKKKNVAGDAEAKSDSSKADTSSTTKAGDGAGNGTSSDGAKADSSKKDAAKKESAKPAATPTKNSSNKSDS